MLNTPSLPDKFKLMFSAGEFQARFIDHLQSLLPHNNEALLQAITYSISTPGKRLRPRLVHEASQWSGLSKRPAELLSYAIELVHTFSLVHDDLPSMDNDDFRRGMPTTHKKFGEAIALLAGDALFGLAFETLSLAAREIETAAWLNGARIFLRSVGADGMIGGQGIEISRSPQTQDELIAIQDLKTTALFRSSVLVPFLWSGFDSNSKEYKSAENFANGFGMAFQIADDLEDEDQDRNSKKNILHWMKKDAAISLAIQKLTSSPLYPQSDVAKELHSKISSKI